MGTSNYTILGITPDATDDQVRSAYKRKALECHPDRHADEDKDSATQKFIEVNDAYRAILRARLSSRRFSTESHMSTSSTKTSSSSCSGGTSKSTEEKAAPKPKPKSTPAAAASSSSAGPSSSSSTSRTPPSSWGPSSRRSFTPPSSTSSTPSSSPSSSPYSTPSSSPYTTPASSPGCTPASSSTSLPTGGTSSPFSSTTSFKKASTFEDHNCYDDEMPHAHSTPQAQGPEPDKTSKPPRAKLRKQPKFPTQESADTTHDYKCNPNPTPTYTAPPPKEKTPDKKPESNTRQNVNSRQEIEIPEYLDTFSPSQPDPPREWAYPIQVTLEDLFAGKHMYFRITRKYQTGKTKGVVLDVDIPAVCHDGTKMVFRDAGHEMKDGTKQDIVFVIREVRHEKFVRGCEWDGGGGKEKGGNKDKEQDEKGTKKREHPNATRYKCGEDDLVMQVRLPWVERLKDEKAKVVVTGVDGKELVFEVDCRIGKGRERPKMSGVAVIEGAGMPLKGGERGTLFIKWDISQITSGSKWESFKQMFRFGK